MPSSVEPVERAFADAGDDHRPAIGDGRNRGVHEFVGPIGGDAAGRAIDAAFDMARAVGADLPDLEPGRMAEMLRHPHAAVAADGDADRARRRGREGLSAHENVASGFSSVDCLTTVV